MKYAIEKTGLESSDYTTLSSKAVGKMKTTMNRFSMEKDKQGEEEKVTDTRYTRRTSKLCLK